jgi:DNA-binding CsgD family transcriptional regulator
MKHVLFWCYIITIIVSAVSLFSSFLIYQKIKTTWYLYYIKFLLSCTFILLSYTVFYFIFRYGYHDTDSLMRYYVLLIFASGLYMLYISFLLLFTLVHPEWVQKRKIYFRLFFILVFLFSIFFFYFHISQRVFTIYIYSLLISFSFIFIYLFYHRKKIQMDQYNRILVIFLFVSLFLLPFDFGEYLLRKNFLHNVHSILPVGFIAFTVYCLVMNYINIIYNMRLLYNPVLDKTDYDDVPQNFSTDYSITEREQEIIEYLVKGYNHQDISGYLKISKRTVDRHIYNIYKKCNIRTRIDLLNLIREYQLPA